MEGTQQDMLCLQQHFHILDVNATKEKEQHEIMLNFLSEKTRICNFLHSSSSSSSSFYFFNIFFEKSI